jgi:integrase
MSTKVPNTWPVVIKAGGAETRIYRRDYTKGAGRYVEFRVGFYLANGLRKFRSFADLDEAKEFARQAALRMASGQASSLTLSASETLDYQRAVASLRPLGTGLGAAVSEYVEAKSVLPNHSLAEAARHFLRTVAPVVDSNINVADAVAEFIASKRSVGRSAVHLRDLETRLGRFAKAFVCRMAGLKRDDVVEWLGTMPGERGELSGRSRNNYLGVVSALVDFARRKRWTSLDLSDVDRFAESAGDVAVFTPGEWTKLLAVARVELVPFLALGGFAGIRSAEISRMTWGQVRFDSELHFPHGWIELRASQAKNAAKLGARARRLIPMAANLRTWLEPHREEGDAPVCRLVRLEDHLRRLAKDAGTPWKKNGPRHSYGSYRLALTNDEGKVALEMGNSPAMIFAHYRQLVTPSQAEAWFGICLPTEAENVVPLTREVA